MLGRTVPPPPVLSMAVEWSWWLLRAPGGVKGRCGGRGWLGGWCWRAGTCGW